MSGGGVREIELTKGKVALVDEADFDWLNQWKWCVSVRYAVRRGPNGLMQMHREIIRPAAGLFVDHIDGDTFNNTRANLRECTTAQNIWNIGPQRVGKLKGAFRSGRYWQAVIRVNRARLYLGTFHSEIDAARAYDAAAIRLHGEFARVNFPSKSNLNERRSVAGVA